MRPILNKAERKKLRKKAEALKILQENKGLLVIDFGCKKNKIPGTVGVDIDPQSDADVLHDLNKFPYPFEVNYADKIFATHIIEHLDDPVRFIREIHRVLKPGGVACIETSHFSNYISYAEPEHKLYYSYFMFGNILDKAKVSFEIKKYQIRFYKTFRFFGIQFLANKFPENYERFWTFMFPAETLFLELAKK